MLGLDSPPVRSDVSEHSASCLSPCGRWLVLVGSHAITIYDVGDRVAPRSLARASEETHAVEVVMAGTLGDGLLARFEATQDALYRAGDERLEGTWHVQALPAGERVELRAPGLPEGWFEFVDRMDVPDGFAEPMLFVSMPAGGALLRRDGAHLTASFARTRGRLLAAHPVGGLVVSTQFGVVIESPGSPVQSLGHERAPSAERFVFDASGHRATWLRDGLLTALAFDEDGGWTVVATRELPSDIEVVDLACAALVWRRAAETAQLGVWRWDVPFDVSAEDNLSGQFARASLAASGAAVLATDAGRGKLAVLSNGAPRFELRSGAIDLTGPFVLPGGFPSTGSWLVASAPDGIHGLVELRHAEDQDDVTRAGRSFVVWHFELRRSVQVLVDHVLARHGHAAWSPTGTLAVSVDDTLTFWHPRHDGRLEAGTNHHLDQLHSDHLVVEWISPDTLAVTAPHTELALLFDDQGRRRLPDHFGPWGFQIPYVGRYSATGRRTQDLYGTTRRTAAAGRQGQVTVELQPSTWSGTEAGSATSMVAYRQGPQGIEIAAVELPHEIRLIFGDFGALNGGTHVFVPVLGSHRVCRVYRITESPLALEEDAVLDDVRSAAATPDHPWLFTASGDGHLEVRHIDDPTTVVYRAPTANDVTWVETDCRGRILTVATAGTRRQWHLDLD